MIIYGKNIAEKVYESLSAPADAYLAIVSIGADEISKSFVAQKRKAAKRVGIELREFNFSSDMPEAEALHSVRIISRDKACGAMLVQLPVPVNYSNALLNSIPEQKDIDVLSEFTYARFCAGDNRYAPPSVAAVKKVIEETQTKLEHIGEMAVIGQGHLIGKPVAQWAHNIGIPKVSIYDKGFDPEALKTADVVVSGAGSSCLFSATYLKEGALVIDFGYAKSETGKLAGDFDPVGAEERNIAYTPTPGGTGPVLVACLMEKFVKMQHSGKKA